MCLCVSKVRSCLRASWCVCTFVCWHAGVCVLLSQRWLFNTWRVFNCSVLDWIRLGSSASRRCPSRLLANAVCHSLRLAGPILRPHWLSRSAIRQGSGCFGLILNALKTSSCSCCLTQARNLCRLIMMTMMMIKMPVEVPVFHLCVPPYTFCRRSVSCRFTAESVFRH